MPGSSRVEQIKRFASLTEDRLPSSDERATIKRQRRRIEQKYGALYTAKEN